MRNHHRKGWKEYVNLLAVFIDSVEGAVRNRIASRHVIAVVGKLFAW